MITDVPPPSAAWRRRALAVAGLLVLLSLPDLLSPPISPTIARQTQTYAQAVNFTAGGFSPRALTIPIDGPAPFRVVYEFPLYQAVTGVLCAAFGPAFFWGKLTSLAAAAAGAWAALELARRRWGADLAWRAGLAFAVAPATLLVSAAFQPDAFALALGAAAGVLLARWRDRPGLARWTAFVAVFLAAALAKFTVLVPFLPLLADAILRPAGRWRRPAPAEVAIGLAGFVLPFVAWNLHRRTLMDPRYLAGENAAFLVGDLTRFLHGGYYVKPAFILGAMVLCGAGVPLALLGLGVRDRAGRLLAAGVGLYFVLIPTAAEQTYYAWPVVPGLAVLAAAGLRRLEAAVPVGRRRWLHGAVAALWAGGFAVAAPYTLRHDHVSLAAARDLAAAGAPADLIVVANLHDRGVGIGGYNPTLFVLAGRRGWNIAPAPVDAGALRRQFAARRGDGARWAVVTWFTPDLDPWFAALLPASFSRCPRLAGVPVEGRAVAEELAAEFKVVARGPNHAVFALAPETR